MKIKSLIILAIIFFSCSHPESKATLDELWGNGQSKKLIIKTKDGNKSYYEINLDSLGRITEITPYLEDGRKIGTQIEFNESFDIAALQGYKANKREGYGYEFYTNDLQILRKGFTYGDFFNGIMTFYYPNGQVENTGNRRMDLYEGEYKEFYENGNIKAKGTYKADTAQNDWNYWTIDGKVDTSFHKK